MHPCLGIIQIIQHIMTQTMSYLEKGTIEDANGIQYIITLRETETSALQVSPTKDSNCGIVGGVTRGE